MSSIFDLGKLSNWCSMLKDRPKCSTQNKSKLKTSKIVLLLCQMCGINSRGNALAINRHNLLPCTFRTSRQRSCNQKVFFVCYVVWLKSMIYGIGLWTSARKVCESYPLLWSRWLSSSSTVTHSWYSLVK